MTIKTNISQDENVLWNTSLSSEVRKRVLQITVSQRLMHESELWTISGLVGSYVEAVRCGFF